MIEEVPSDSPRRCPKGNERAEVGTSDWFLKWELVVVLGDDAAVVADKGLGEERPSGAENGRAERGVGVGVGVRERPPVDEAEERRLLVDDIGVKGEARGCGELSVILADFGGTSGGVLPDLRRVLEDFRRRR
jgi:hypothetical protein